MPAAVTLMHFLVDVGFTILGTGICRHALLTTGRIREKEPLLVAMEVAS